MSHPEKTRVLFLNRSYWPDTEATGQLLTELCEGLAKDFDVHVLAGRPNATAGEVSWKGVHQRNGVTIHRVEHSAFPKSNMFLKGLNLISFAVAGRHQILKLPIPHVVVFETDPFLLPFVADRLHARHAVPMVGYLQDIYPDVAVALGKIRDSLLVRTLRKKLFEVYRRCTRMVVLSSDMQKLLLTSGIAQDRIDVIPNWADAERIHPIPRDENIFLRREGLLDRFVVMYSGNLGLTQRLEDFVEAARLLKGMDHIEFVFIGRGARKAVLQKLVHSSRLKNVRFLDYVPQEELAHSLSAADLHLVPLASKLTGCLMPSKLYGILAAGRPYLTNAADNSELYRITAAYRIGLTVEANSPEQIADALRSASQSRDVLNQMGKRGRDLAETCFTRSASTTAFQKVLENAVKEHKEVTRC
ncbi:MAG: glycosyltransferase family 4 protein [Planctomycetaceae bacterium]